MFYFERFNQHTIQLYSECNYICLGCRHQHGRDHNTDVKSIQPHDIVNIYGSDLSTSDQLPHILRICESKKAKIRVFGNHHLLNLPHSLLNMIHEFMIWCPSPDADEFDFMVGKPTHSLFKETIERHRHRSITLVFFVRPLSFSMLPHAYDTCVSMNTQGWVLYIPNEFTKEQRRYIKRMNRVPGMCVLTQKNTATTHCFGVPNTMGTMRFEAWEWWHETRKKIKKWPVLKPFI
jgi:hypothetical protein